jgi:hypothetical protein
MRTTPLFGGKARFQCERATFAGIESPAGMMTMIRCLFHEAPLISLAEVLFRSPLWAPVKSCTVKLRFHALIHAIWF